MESLTIYTSGRPLWTQSPRRKPARKPFGFGGTFMGNVRVCAGFFFACLGSAAVSAPAQEVVHALTGTVSTINSVSKTITVFKDNGSQGVFEDANSKTRYSFDKKIAAESTAADAFNQQGAYVIVFYVGEIESPSVVALKSLGKGPFKSTEGTVEKFDGKGHSIAITDKSGAVQTFRIDPQTVAEGDLGVEEGFKFHAQKGDQVRVVSSSENGAATALFVRDM
jgi:hypothetical protein